MTRSIIGTAKQNVDRDLDNENAVRIRIGQRSSNGSIRKKKHLNRIKTTKYTWLTFIPINFYEQFRRAVYFYFLLITIVSFFVKTTLSPMTSLIPLLFVMIVTAIKEGLEDYERYKSDRIINKKLVTIIRDDKECEIPAEDIEQGDLLALTPNCDVPCDLILLQTTDTHGKCYITTTNLDGETNLKTLFVPHELLSPSTQLPPPSPPPSRQNINAYNGFIVCEQSKADLYSFNGRIELNNNNNNGTDNDNDNDNDNGNGNKVVIPLTKDNLLLRGAHIKNTHRIIACAIYTGMNTKLQLNSRYTGNKSASSEIYINRYIIILIMAMLLCVLILYLIECNINPNEFSGHFYLGTETKTNSFLTVIDDILAFLILFNYIVPISMYMNIEFYRVFGAIFMRSDLQLYDEETDQPCLVNCSNLNEDLGQINIIFSDKTGTLTKNEMKFSACSINGRQYAYHETYIEDVLTGEKYSSIGNEFNNNQLEFLKALSICHTVQVVTNEEDEKDFTGITYQATSPDEKALLEACDSLGLIYEGDFDGCIMRLLNRIEEVQEQQQQQQNYKRLHLLEFNSERRRMSIIVKDLSNDHIILYTKGAENSIFPLCAESSSSMISITDKHITDFACQGLRTLAVAWKILSVKDYEDFSNALNIANTSLKATERDEQITKCYAMVEKDLILLGATAVEDSLQDDVDKTLLALQEAGIKIWVLTGDKVETALNIALASKHIKNNCKLYYLIDKANNTNSLKEELQEMEKETQMLTTQNAIECALIIDGKSLSIAMANPESRLMLRTVALRCVAVLCCRLSPLQKCEIVELIKETHKYLTAAIGDGANDVSMIQAAHIGIGIMGLEGRQAAQCADYAISRFGMLRRLLLVHGHYHTVRLAFLVLFYCYKNLIILGCMVLYQIYDLYSATSVFSSLYLWLFDIIYISFSFTYLAMSEKPYKEEELMRQPSLYKKNTHNRQASFLTFTLWMLNALIHTAIIFYFAYCLISNNDAIIGNADGQTADFYCFGTMLMQVIVIVGNLKLLLSAHYLSYLNLGFIASGILGFMLSTFIVNIWPASMNGSLNGVYTKFLCSLTMWLYTVITTTVCLLSDLIQRLLLDCYAKGFSQ